MPTLLVSRIDRFLTAQPLHESAAGDLAVKLLKQHNMVPEGADPHHIAKGIAKRHGVPMMLVPQMVHYAAASNRDDDTFREHRLATAATPPVPGTPLHHAMHTGKDTREAFLHAYSAVGSGKLASDGDESHPLHSESSSHLPSRFEHAADLARNWHEIATHPKRATIIDHALHDRVRDTPVADHEVGGKVSEIWANSVARTGLDRSPLRRSYDTVQTSAKNYNPLRSDTWHPGYTGGVTSMAIPLPTDVPQDQDPQRVHNGANRLLVDSATKHLVDRKGLQIPHAANAEHVHGGVTYKGYTLDTPEKANAGCWGNKYCISTGTSASDMNEHYHGGKYKPAHIITKVTHGDDSKPRETLHAAYLPELLPGQKHENPEQAVRNSGNNGPMTGEAFSAIHPLLQKLDKRIDKKFRGHPPVHELYRNNDLGEQ